MKEIRFTNGRLIGHIYQEVDGFYVFLPIENNGFWTEQSLMFVFDKLTELNNEWNEQLQVALHNPITNIK